MSNYFHAYRQSSNVVQIEFNSVSYFIYTFRRNINAMSIQLWFSVLSISIVYSNYLINQFCILYFVPKLVLCALKKLLKSCFIRNRNWKANSQTTNSIFSMMKVEPFYASEETLIKNNMDNFCQL